MIYTTLNRIRAHAPCAEGWKKLLNHLGKTRAADEPLALVTVLDSNGVDDALWCLRAEPQHAAIWHLLAVHYARQVRHLTTDQRSLNALDVAERHAHGLATDAELEAASAATWDAAWDAAHKEQADDLRTVLTHHHAELGKYIHGWGRDEMTNKQPEALRLADHLERFRSFPDDLAAAAELRRLHAENEAKDALLRQALEALEYCRSGEDCHPTPTSEAIDALKERLK